MTELCSNCLHKGRCERRPPKSGYCDGYIGQADCRTCARDCQFIGCYMPQFSGCAWYVREEQT